MKILIILSTLLSASTAYGLNYQDYIEVKVAIEKAFLELRPDESHTLEVNQPAAGNANYWWDLDIVHASYHGYRDGEMTKHFIFLFGGFIRLKGMTKDGLAITACHEIGHGLGGEPKKTTGSSSEGQSDYYSTKTCLPIVFKYLKKSETRKPTEYMKSLCWRYNPTDDQCIRAMLALESDREFFKAQDGTIVFYNQKSEVMATELDDSPSFYPEPQCRFDTSIHGVLQLERPICWYPQGIERAL